MQRDSDMSQPWCQNGMLRRADKKLSIKAKFRVYKAVIRPALEYGSPAMLNLPSELSCALERFQRRILRSIQHNNDPVPLDSLALRSVAALQIFHSIVHKRAPEQMLISFILSPKRFSRSIRLASLNHPYLFEVPGGPRSSRQFESSFFHTLFGCGTLFLHG